jgi:hypothetical protein
VCVRACVCGCVSVCVCVFGLHQESDLVVQCLPPIYLSQNSMPATYPGMLSLSLALSRSLARSLSRSLALSLSRSLALSLSLARSLARSLSRSLALSLSRSTHSLCHTHTHKTHRATGARHVQEYRKRASKDSYRVWAARVERGAGQGLRRNRVTNGLRVASHFEAGRKSLLLGNAS